MRDLSEVLGVVVMLFIAIGLLYILWYAGTNQHTNTKQYIRHASDEQYAKLESKVAKLQSELAWHVVNHDVIEPKPLIINGEKQ